MNYTVRIEFLNGGYAHHAAIFARIHYDNINISQTGKYVIAASDNIDELKLLVEKLHDAFFGNVVTVNDRDVEQIGG